MGTVEAGISEKQLYKCDQYIRGTCGKCYHGAPHQDNGIGQNWSCSEKQHGCSFGIRGNSKCKCIKI